MIKICPECNNEFLDKYNTRTFCSHACANKNHWRTRKRVNRVEFVCQMCGRRFFCKENETRVKQGSVKFCSKKCSNEALKTGKITNCPICGKQFYTTRRTCCSVECAREYKKQNAAHKTYMENGYKVVYVNGYNKKGNAKVHRLVMEKAIGRRLTGDEVVHHIDGDKTNNSIKNLVILSKGEHSRLHRELEKQQNKKFFTKRFVES